jgi:hypothetical protein
VAGRTSKPLGRRYGSRPLGKRFLIFCEGAVTEKIYLDGIKRELHNAGSRSSSGRTTVNRSAW